jgi:DNA polymerase-4
MGHEQTFPRDLEDPDAVRAVMLRQAEAVARRLRKAGVRARTVVVKIRYGDFETITRSHTLDRPTDLTREVWEVARELFDAWARTFRPVRLVGVTAAGLVHDGGQGDLFERARRDRDRRVDEAVDRLRDRFGGDAIHRGG